MAIRIQNLPKKNFDGSSLHSLSHLSVSGPPWRNSNEQQMAQSISQNISLKVETPSQLYHNAKHLHLQLPDQESTSAHAIGQSHHEVRVMGVTNSHCNSSESAGQDESRGKDIEGRIKPVFLLKNPSSVFSTSHPNYNFSMACAPHPYADAYCGGLFTPYGQQAIIQAQMAGSAPTRIPLPLALEEGGETIYVNAKQYHGILRRRQRRAKLEAQNKLDKSRRPYLHESRHLHALNRARGLGGRFLSRKKLQQFDPHPTFNTTSHCTSDASSLDQRKNGRAGLESRRSRTVEYTGSSTSCSDITSVSNSDGKVQQPQHRFPGISRGGGHIRSSGGTVCNGIQHCASVVR